MISPPPKLEDLRAGTRLIAGLGYSTILPDMDFETYSPAGFVWNEEKNKFVAPHGCRDKGLPATGAARYSEHPDAEVLCLAYDLKDGNGRQLWKPEYNGWGHYIGMTPFTLYAHIVNGGLIEAWNVSFEYWVWTNICVPKYGFPPLDPKQLRCAAAKSRAHALPGSLAPAGTVVGIQNQKDKDGKRLINRFCIPRDPTLKNDSKRILPHQDPQDAQRLYEYCLRDIQAESELSSLTPDLSEDELKFWQCDHAINVRGVQIDLPLIDNCIKILETVYDKYNQELCSITDGVVKAASKLPDIKKYLESRGVSANSLTDDIITELLQIPELPEDVLRILRIRQMAGSASVKKLYAMKNQVCKDGRLHDLFIYHSARTGRAAGTGPQPQNLPNSGPELSLCKQCDKHYFYINGCPYCGHLQYEMIRAEWNPKAVEEAVKVLNTGNLAAVEHYYGNAVEMISSCLRGMFISAPGKDLLCSDYSAIEAVVLAAIAGEEWRLEVFRTHGKIYEMSGAKITHIPFEEVIEYAKVNGKHHPCRKLGKVAELASGFGGWVGGWKAFGAGEFYTDREIRDAVSAWRNASPSVVQLWYGLEKAAKDAVGMPGAEFIYNGIKYICKQDVLYCTLLSGRLITYHKPILSIGDRGLSLSYEGWNTNPKHGRVGWTRMETYGGKLTENVVQATARDILAHAIVNLEQGGYPVVLHVHDEIVCELPEGQGDIRQMEYTMSTMPEWAEGWPVIAKGGWKGKRYAK